MRVSSAPNPKTPTFSPQLSEGNVTPHSDQGFVAQATPEKGFVDTSTAESIAYWGGQALDAHKGYREAELEVAVENEVESFIDSKLKNSTVDSVAVEEGNYNQDELDALASVKKEADKIRRAKVSGARNSTELNIRIEALAKRSIAAMPGLAGDFRRILSNVRGDNKTELKLIESQEEAAANASKMQEAFIRSAGIAAQSIGIQVVGRSLKEWYPEYLKNQHKINSKNQLENAIEMQAMQKEILLNDPEVALTYIEGDRLIKQSQFFNIAEGPEVEGQDKATRIAFLKDAAIQEITAKFSVNGGKPNAMAEAHIATITRMAEIATARADGSYSLEQLNRENQTAKAMAMSGLLEIPGMPTLIASSQVMGNSIQKLRIDTEMAAKLFSHYGDVIEGKRTFKEPNARTKEDREVTSRFFESLDNWVGAYVDLPDEEQAANSKFIVKAMEGVVNDWYAGETPEALDGLLKVASNPAMHKFLAMHDKEGTLRGKIENIAEQFIEGSVEKRFHEIFDADVMRLGMSPDGTLTISAYDKANPETIKTVSNLTRNYVSRFNMYVKAKAHMEGANNYKDYMEPFIGRMSAIADMAAANKDEEGNQVVTDVRQITPQNASNFVKPLDKTARSKEAKEAGPTYGAAAGYAVVPSLYDLYYGEDVNDWEVLSNHIGQIYNALTYGQQLSYLEDIARLPIYKAFKKGLRKDENGNRVWWSKKEREENRPAPSPEEVVDPPETTEVTEAPEGPTTIKTVDDYNKLPSGAVYVDPQGKTRVKR